MINNLKPIALLMAVALMLNACNKDSNKDPEEITDDSVRITEIQKKMGSEYKTSSKFIYDEKIRLSEVLENYWEENEATGDYYLKEENKYVFAWGADEKLQKVTYFKKLHNETQWEERGYFEVVYAGDLITQTSYNRAGTAQKEEQYDFTWNNAKVGKTTCTSSSNSTYEIIFSYDDNGNCTPITRSTIDVYDNYRYESNAKTTNTYDLSKQSIFAYMPLEYFLLFGGDNIGSFQSKNIITKTLREYNYTDSSIIPSEKKNEGKSTYTSTNAYTYDANNRVIEFTETYVDYSKYTDYEDPSQSYEKIEDPEVFFYKIIYNK